MEFWVVTSVVYRQWYSWWIDTIYWKRGTRLWLPSKCHQVVACSEINSTRTSRKMLWGNRNPITTEETWLLEAVIGEKHYSDSYVEKAISSLTKQVSFWLKLLDHSHMQHTHALANKWTFLSRTVDIARNSCSHWNLPSEITWSPTLQVAIHQTTRRENY